MDEYLYVSRGIDPRLGSAVATCLKKGPSPFSGNLLTRGSLD